MPSIKCFIGTYSNYMVLVLGEVQFGDSRTSQIIYELFERLNNIQNNEIVSLLY